MPQFTWREGMALTAVAGAITLGAVGYHTLRVRQPGDSTAVDVRPHTLDGSPAAVATNADGTLAIAAKGADSAATPNSEIVVYVTGAVKQPGVYALRPGARIVNAIHAAGGFKANAQQEALNLADMVQDADQINVPATRPADRFEGEAIRTEQRHSDAVPVAAAMTPRITVRPIIIPGRALVAATGPAKPRPHGRVLGTPAVAAADGGTGTISGLVTPPSSGGEAPDRQVSPPEGAEVAPPPSGASAHRISDKLKSAGDGVVNINTAPLEELERLPGIGPAMAQRVIDYRTQIGSFTSIDQLRDVKGIGDKRLEKLRPFIVVN